MKRTVVAIGGGLLLAACTSASSAPTDAGPDAGPCTPIAQNPADPFIAERDPASMDVAFARRIADRYMAVHPAAEATWNWTDGILMFAMMELHRVTGESAYRDYARAYVDAKLPDKYIITKSDACPPMLVALALHRESCDAKYRAPIDDTLKYLYEVSPRTPEGALSHLGTFTAFGTTVWIDSLFMIGQPMIRYGEWNDDKRALDFYSVQYRFNADKNQGPSGFFMHAWNWPGEQTPNTYWARGNSWVLTSAADYLRVRAKRGESDPPVRDSFVKLMNAVVATQDPATGLYFTIIDQPGKTYLETSATALFALGLARARRAGVAGPEVLPVIAKAMTGVRSKIVSDAQGRPYVTGISGPTDVGPFQDYATVPLVDDLSFGVGGVLLALLEVSGLK